MSNPHPSYTRQMESSAAAPPGVVVMGAPASGNGGDGHQEVTVLAPLPPELRAAGPAVVALSASPEHKSAGLGETNLGCLVHLSGGALTGSAADKPAVDVIACVDCSGSMSGDMKLVQQTLSFVLRELRSCDRLSIVCFSDDASVPLTLRALNAEGQSAATTAIKQMRAGGSTNLSGGAIAALTQLVAAGECQQDRPASILLLTDGAPTSGIRNKEDLVEAVKKTYIDTGGNCPINCFGFGNQHDVSLMSELAQCTGGMYTFIEGKETISGAFGEALGGITSLVAQSIQLRITAAAADAGGSIKRVFSSATVSTEGTVHTVAFGDLQAEETRDIVVEIDLPVCKEAEDLQGVLSLGITYFDVARKELVQQKTTVAVDRKSDAAVELERKAEDDAQKAVRIAAQEQRQRVLVVEALAEAKRCADRRELSKAREIVAKAEAALDASGELLDGSVLATELHQDLQLVASVMQDSHTYHDMGGSSITSSSYMSHSRQRANSMGSSDLRRRGNSSSYGTPSQRSSTMRSIDAHQDNLPVSWMSATLSTTAHDPPKRAKKPVSHGHGPTASSPTRRVRVVNSLRALFGCPTKSRPESAEPSASVGDGDDGDSARPSSMRRHPREARYGNCSAGNSVVVGCGSYRGLGCATE